MTYTVTTKRKTYTFNCSTPPWISADITEEQWVKWIQQIVNYPVTPQPTNKGETNE